MSSFIREHFGALVLAVLLHVAIIVALVGGFIKFESEPTPQPAAQLAIEGTVVDEKQIVEEMQRQEREEQDKERQAQERAEQLKREQEAEEQRLADLKQQREQEEEAERQRVEKQKLEEAERQRQAEAEAKRKAEEEAKAEAERKRKAEADRKRREEEARKKAAEDRAKAEREAALRRQLAEEERRRAAVDSGLLAQYVAQIKARVQRAWIRPPSVSENLRCVVNVTQVPGGEVVGVSIGECNGDEVVRRSIEAAVYRASPLPEPSDPTLFDKNLRLEFTGND